MITKHTPGPWKYDDTYGLIMAKDVEIAACHSGIKANANLIAAAPEMLKALLIAKKYIDYAIEFGDTSKNTADIHLIDEAIKKARGEDE